MLLLGIHNIRRSFSTALHTTFVFVIIRSKSLYILLQSHKSLSLSLSFIYFNVVCFGTQQRFTIKMWKKFELISWNGRDKVQFRGVLWEEMNRLTRANWQLLGPNIDSTNGPKERFLMGDEPLRNMMSTDATINPRNHLRIIWCQLCKSKSQQGKVKLAKLSRALQENPNCYI